MSFRTLTAGRWVLALMLAFVPLWGQNGPTVRPRTLAQMTKQAHVIVRGQVVSAVVENHPTLTHLPTVLVTLRVKDTLKGSAAETFTFREFLWTTARTRAVPSQYQPGRELLLLMRSPSQYGLSSPVGLDQGTFRILRDKDGKEVAVNARNNRDLFSDTSHALGAKYATLSPTAASAVRTVRPGPVRVSELSEIIRRLVEVQ